MTRSSPGVVWHRLRRAEWIAYADSMLAHGRHADALVDQMLEVMPHHRGRIHDWMSWTSTRSESGTESLLRVALRSRGIRATCQVQIGPDRVDLLVGDGLVIECDSVAHHSSSPTTATTVRATSA